MRNAPRPAQPRTIQPNEPPPKTPYRRVWRSLAFEGGILAALTVGLWGLSLFGVTLPPLTEQVGSLLFVFLPLGLWLLFSALAERRAPITRPALPAVVALSALVANAVGMPIVHDLFQLERWLPLASSTTRILGFTFSLYITQELIKYAVVRVLGWPHISTREDALAYTLASAVGYTTVANLHDWAAAEPAVLFSAFSVFGAIALSYAASIVVSYGLGEMKLARSTAFLMPLSLAAAAFLQGFTANLRSGFVNPAFSIAGGGPSVIIGIAVSGGVLAAVGAAFVFFFRTAERREREAVQRDV